MELWKKVTIGLIAGIIFGVFYPEYVQYLKPIGDMFLRSIKMLIGPLIFFSIISGISSFEDRNTIGRVGLKATVAFLTTTLFATCFGISIAEVLRPGYGVLLNLPTNSIKVNNVNFDFIKFFVEIVPNNVLESFVSANTIQIVFFAIFTGITINSMNSSSAQNLKNFFSMMMKMMLRMISIVIQFSPYGAFALTAWIVGLQGLEVLFSLSKLVIAVIIAMFLQYMLFGVFILIFCRFSPIPFYKKSIEYQLIAFSTGSSKASLPTTMKVCRENLGVSEASTSFILPLGASINMDGFAINLSLTTIFFAQVLNVTLSMQDYLLIMMMSTIGSIGGAGIPGASLIMLPMVLSSVNLPIEGVAILVGIDRILDLVRTVINITGDATITLILDKSEGTLDEEQYFS